MHLGKSMSLIRIEMINVLYSLHLVGMFLIDLYWTLHVFNLRLFVALLCTHLFKPKACKLWFILRIHFESFISWDFQIIILKMRDQVIEK